jgi:hypothetical protein
VKFYPPEGNRRYWEAADEVSGVSASGRTQQEAESILLKRLAACLDGSEDDELVRLALAAAIYNLGPE